MSTGAHAVHESLIAVGPAADRQSLGASLEQQDPHEMTEM